MPNHVKNVWKINNIPEDKVDYLVNRLTRLYPSDKTRVIDFDLIIPEPKLEIDCPKKYIRTELSHVQEDELKPWFDWYKWHCDKWGTKWGAYDGYTQTGKTWIRLVFSTAWYFPEPIARQLAVIINSLGCDLDIRYADEALGSNCGRITYCSHSGEWNEYFGESLSSNTRQWADRLWTTW